MTLWYKDLQCECGQKFVEESLQATIYIYGVFFLEGLNDSFVGTTCPSCFKTIFINVETNEFNQIISWFKERDYYTGSHLFIPLGYFSPPQNWIKSNFLRNSPYQSEVGPDPSDEELDGLEKRLKYYENCNIFLDEYDEPLQEGQCYRSYIYGLAEILGVVTKVYWFTKEEVQKAINRENYENKRCFPRYIHKFTLLKKIDEFYAKHFFLDHFLQEQKELQAKTIAQLQDKGIDPKTVMAEEDEVPLWLRGEENFDLATDFLKILTDISPFIENRISTSLNNSETVLSTFERLLEKRRLPFKIVRDEEYSNKITDIKKYFAKEYSQDFLQKEAGKFIESCRDKFQCSHFSPIDIWGIKQNFFSSFCEHIEDWKLKSTDFAIIREGKTWKIIFDGVHTSGIKQDGFVYIQHLVKNPGIIFHTNELAEEIDHLIVGKTAIQPASSDVQDSLRRTDGIDHEELATEDIVESYRSRLHELSQNRAHAEDTVESIDQIRIHEIDREFNLIKKEVDRLFYKGKARSNQQTPAARNKARISKAIERAIKSIYDDKKNIGDKEARDHFMDALKPINSYFQEYKPRENFEWFLKK